MPNNLTDNEIKKALECCVSAKHICPHTCPMLKNEGCLESLRKYALDLINRQQAQIEKLEKVEHFADKTIATQKAEVERLKTENAVIMKQALAENKTTATAIMKETEQRIMTAERIKRLKEEIERLRKALNTDFSFVSARCNGKTKRIQEIVTVRIKTIKAEAYKEAFEKVKNYIDVGHLRKPTEICFSGLDVVEMFDNLLNELVGGSDGEEN